MILRARVAIWPAALLLVVLSALLVVVVKHDDNSITGYKTLAGKTVGGISGGNDGEIPARKMAEEFGAFKAFKGYAGYAEMFSDLAIGRVDAVVSPDLAAANAIMDSDVIKALVAEFDRCWQDRVKRSREFPSAGGTSRAHPW